MSSSNQRPANRGFRSVLRCVISHYRQVPSLSAPEPFRPAKRTLIHGEVVRTNPGTQVAATRLYQVN